MEKKLVLLTAVFALTAGLVFAEDTKATEPAAADSSVTMPADETVGNEDVVSNEMMGNEVMSNEVMSEDLNAAEEGAAEEPAASEAPEAPAAK